MHLSRKEKQKAIKYCVRDTTITYRTAKLLHEFYSEFNINPKSTLPASAMAIWREHFWKQPIELPAEEILSFARECYFGGRTEAFSIGTFKNVSVIDAASMYPWAMTVDKFPIPWGEFKRVRKGDKPNALGIYKANIQSSIYIPALPIRTGSGLIFPNGNFQGYFTGEEIIYVSEILGCKYNIISGFVFTDNCDPFSDYVGNFFTLKNNSRGPKKVMYKLILNSLYGKFGQKGEHTVALDIEEFRQLANPPEDFVIWNGLVLYLDDGEIPIWGNVVWSAIITARARIKLHKEMMRLLNSGARVLYCDTDSVTFIPNKEKEIRYPEKAKEPGQFEKRGDFKTILITGKKEYGLQDKKGLWEFSCKGVPYVAREEYLKTGKATYVKPTKLKEASRSKTKANVWKSVTKTRKVNYDSRERRSDGSLKPIEIHS